MDFHFHQRNGLCLSLNFTYIDVYKFAGHTIDEVFALALCIGFVF